VKRANPWRTRSRILLEVAKLEHSAERLMRTNKKAAGKTEPRIKNNVLGRACMSSAI
jgi:hypothetical protein